MWSAVKLNTKHQLSSEICLHAADMKIINKHFVFIFCFKFQSYLGLFFPFNGEIHFICCNLHMMDRSSRYRFIYERFVLLQFRNFFKCLYFIAVSLKFKSG